ncbi:hypothetical protein [Tepidibacter hydrothermalis]|uniref:HK97 gp10 family phage protein n=1 Tax=Tepidibacter hydrothermalis TaxID=3036126 RepID=A0ABY8EGF6_9FIRM|nr:hypothetical protein [Tepidibacter hydrothermalis]WFD12011.1 hypothetical protein P4S50_08010 [Tepidibacter hydrothermalis]
MSFRMDITGALKGLAEAELKMKAAVGLYANTAGKKLEGYAKQNAPWTDHTAQARQSIQGGHEWQGNKCNIFVAGNKEYSPFLEFCNEGKYAILYPTVRNYSAEIILGMQNLLGK